MVNTKSIPSEKEARRAKSGMATPDQVTSAVERGNAIMEFDDENSEASSEPAVVSAQHTGRGDERTEEEASIEEGNSEIAVSRQDHQGSAGALPLSFTSTPRQMYVEHESPRRGSC